MFKFVICHSGQSATGGGVGVGVGDGDGGGGCGGGGGGGSSSHFSSVCVSVVDSFVVITITIEKYFNFFQTSIYR